VFRAAFLHAGLPYYNPHSLRSTLAQFGETLCKTPEDFKAWSQNLGHEQVLTTFRSYGHVSTKRQSEILCELALPNGRTSPADGPRYEPQLDRIFAELAELKEKVGR